ncbi:MAG TPA: dolichyl-phosphate beta-glucosyltransferase [Chloroflexia bacterium]|nr:dolichyl-phosphate beta-glucosyltransferase [Chloroflexia bacterium]
MSWKDVLVEIVIPVYNEQEVLEKSVNSLRAYLLEYFPYRWRITIADNASIDKTWEIAQRLQETYSDVKAVHLDQKGRGRALRYVWSNSDADVVSYMDVDLSTNLKSFLPLVAPIITGHSDLAIGSRLARGAIVTRQWKREIISRCYNFMIKLSFFNAFSDAQCGFKACRTDVARRLLPLIENNEWFFDTEMLLLAEHNHLPIYEVPVEWIEDLDSRVKIVKTAMEDVKGLVRIRKLFFKGEGLLPPAEVVKPSIVEQKEETAILK